MKKEREDKAREEEIERREEARQEKRQDEEEREDEREKKRQDERENERENEEKRKEGKDDFFRKNVSRPSNPPDELAQKCFEKKSVSDELFLLFFCKSAESGRFFIYLHDSNSIFRAQGIKSEWVLWRTVLSFLSKKGTAPPLQSESSTQGGGQAAPHQEERSGECATTQKKEMGTQQHPRGGMRRQHLTRDG